MRKIIKGHNYNFCITAEGEKFYIKASHIVSSRFSFINNLNAILSELIADFGGKEFEESQWVLPIKRSRLFFDKAIDFLSDIVFCDYIESRLDEDRGCGEWENFETH